MEFNWEIFKVKNISVECCNKEEVVDFLDSLKNNDIDGHELKEHLLDDNECFEYPIYFIACYSSFDYSHNYSVEWSDDAYYQKSNYTILKWKNYMNCNSEYLEE